MGTASELSRRNFMKTAAIAAGAAGVAALGTASIARAEEAPAEGPEAPAEDAAVPAAGGFSMDGFCQWALDGGNSGSTAATFFLPGEENRPTDEELNTMLQTANTYFQCHGLTGTHFLVIKDPEEQQEIFKYMGADGTGTVAVLVLADGCNDQDHHAEEYFPGPQTENPQYWQMPYAVFEAGWATGYLNLAARSMGYRTHVYGALNIPNAVTGEVMLYDTADSWEYIQIGMWNIEKYMQPKDGGEQFDHYCEALDRKLLLDGNLTLLCAMLIGKIDETDADSGATASFDYKLKYRENYDFWG